MSLTKYISEGKLQTITKQEALAVAYRRALKHLHATQVELLAQGEPQILVELHAYEGANGYPNQPYLEVYRPYANGGFKILANCDGYLDVRHLEHVHFRTDIDRARKYIATLWLNIVSEPK